MSRISPRLPLPKPTFKAKPRIKILRKLAPDPFARTAAQPLFQHARNQGQAHFLPHSLQAQKQRYEEVLNHETQDPLAAAILRLD